MKKRLIVPILIAAGFLPLEGSSENIRLRISGGGDETRISLQSRGDHLNFYGNLSINHEGGSIHSDILSIGGKPIITYPGLQAGGAFSARLETKTADGEKTVSGNIVGKDIFFLMPGEGLAVEEGRLKANVRDNRVFIENLSFEEHGRLHVSGEIGFQNRTPDAEISILLEKFPLFRRPGRHLNVSGTSDIRLENGAVYAGGDFHINSADIFIEDIEPSAPRPSADIIILGEEKSLPAPLYPIEEASVRINLGDNFRIRSDELNALLGGELRILLKRDSPQAVNGSIIVREGTYRAYGQEMYVRRGILTFTGPPDNAGINILALHKHRRIDVGVSITGTLASPVIELYSDPDMPDVEKLSYLVLGRSYATAGSGGVSLIAAAAAAILAPEEYAKLEAEILKTTGLDEIRLEAEDQTEETVIVLGKQLSSRLFFTYKRGLAGLTNAAILEYFLSPRWILHTETGYESLIGITYSISFD